MSNRVPTRIVAADSRFISGQPPQWEEVYASDCFRSIRNEEEIARREKCTARLHASVRWLYAIHPWTTPCGVSKLCLPAAERRRKSPLYSARANPAASIIRVSASPFGIHVVQYTPLPPTADWPTSSAAGK